MNNISLVDRMRPYVKLINYKSAVISYFEKLEFNEEEHRYNVGVIPLTSVSATIKKYVEYVDFDMIAGFVAKKRGVDKQVVLDEWEEGKNYSCDLGTEVHNFGETYTETFIAPDNIECGLKQAVVNFWKSLPEHIVPFLFELKMYSETFRLAGTADIILYNTLTGKFIIADYKTNKDLFKNHKGKKLLFPFNNMLDMPYSKYVLQLSYYQILLEQTGIEVEARKIIWLKPNGTFEIYSTKDVTEELKQGLVTN